MNVIPAVLPHSFEEIAEKLSRVEGIAQTIQIDLCDGVFGREKTWLPLGTEMLPPNFSYEFDVMLNDWRESMLHALALGATSIVAHVDMFSDEDITTLVSIVAPHACALGVSVSNDKSLEFHAEMIRKIKVLYPNIFIQVMGIKQIGEQGQVFDEEAPARIKTLKQQFGDIKVQVDGGITEVSAKLVFDAGASAVVVGSYIFGGSDAGAAIGTLSAIGE
jgi:ribulose-phosphate 3-epimerase